MPIAVFPHSNRISINAPNINITAGFLFSPFAYFNEDSVLMACIVYLRATASCVLEVCWRGLSRLKKYQTRIKGSECCRCIILPSISGIKAAVFIFFGVYARPSGVHIW